MSDTMTLRIGMIGPGGMGQAHIERIHSVIAGGRVVAVTDLNARRVKFQSPPFSSNVPQF